MNSKVVAVQDKLSALGDQVDLLAGVAAAKRVADLDVAVPVGTAPCSKIDDVAALRRDFLTLATLVGHSVHYD